jgi:hypothetical protein
VISQFVSDSPASVRGKIVPDDFAVFHHESNAFELGDISDRIFTDGNEVSKLSGSTVPMRSCQPNISAALHVIARITSSDGIPARRKLTKISVLASPRVFPG